MSHPDPKAWAMTDNEERAMLDYWRDNAPETGGEFVVESIARRRVLEELRAIRDAYPEETRALHERIAEIETEEATPLSASE